MAYSFDQVFAADPANPANIASNAAVLIYQPGDPTKTPLVITDPSGGALTNPVIVNANGFGSAFMHATLDRVAWDGGGFSGFFTSYEGMKNEAVDARNAAEEAATTAAASAQTELETRIAAGEFNGAPGTPGADGSNILPTDTAIKNAIENTGSETRGAIDARILGATGVTTADPAHTTKIVPGTGKNALFIRSEQATYALKVDQYDNAGVHDTVNIAANFAGAHTPFSVNSGNTTLSTVKIVNTAVQTGGAVIVGVATAPGRTAQVIQADNYGAGASFLATQEPGATGVGVQIQYLDAGSGTTTYSTRALWISGHHTGGSLAYIENDKAQTSGNLLHLVQANAASTAPALEVSPVGTGPGIKINASGASILLQVGANFSVDNNGAIRSPQWVNSTTFNNARIQTPTTGVIVDRNVNDANPVFTVQNLNASFTGNIQEWRNNAGTAVAKIRPNGCITPLTTTTASRPLPSIAGAGAQYYDTTLAKPVYSDGTTWRDAAGTSV